MTYEEAKQTLIDKGYWVYAKHIIQNVEDSPKFLDAEIQETWDSIRNRRIEEARNNIITLANVL